MSGVLLTRLRKEAKMNEKPNSTSLKHYGVKGMRWGVRKDRRSRSKGSKDYKRAKALSKKNRKDLTNREMQELIKRKSLEKQYKTVNPSTVSRGMSAANSILKVTATASRGSAAIIAAAAVGKKVVANAKYTKGFMEAYPYLKKAASSLN
jgi:hypothetical protein